MSCPPQLVNTLVVEISDSETFSPSTTLELPAATSNFPVNGASGGTKYVRAKWRRTAAVEGPPAIPAEESDWSNTVVCTFPPIQGADIASLPTGCEDGPAVPVIHAVFGWSEFIEVSLLGGGSGSEGVTAYYAGIFASGTTGSASGLFVQNTSTDPSVRVEQVDFLMGSNSPNTAGFTSFDSDPIDSTPLVSPRQTIASNTNITTIDTGDPGSPKRNIDYFVSFLGAALPKWVQWKLIPQYEGGPNVCPQDSTIEHTIPLAYYCDDAFFGARLQLVDFSETDRGVANPKIMVQVYAKVAVVYIDALQRTVFPPFLPAQKNSSGFYGSFEGNLSPGLPPARIKVRFSTGLVIDRDAVAVGTDCVGLRYEPSGAIEKYQLDDFFLFVSASEFSETLDSETGDWQDALNNLPSGVYVARVARETNLLASNLFGNRLENDTTYFFRVGARRFTSFCQAEPDYQWSATLSEIATGQLRTSLSEGVPTTPGGPIVTPGTEEVQIVAGDGILIDLDETAKTITVSLDTANIRESGGFLFVVPGNATVGTNVCFDWTADHDGTCKDWVLHALTAPTGASLIVDVHKNGSSIFADGGNRPTLSAGQTAATGQSFNVPAYLKGDVFRFDIDQVGSTLPGTRVELQVNADSPLRILT